MGKMCISVTKKDKMATISEELCNGCNICTKKCPFGAINIINLPSHIPKDIIHRYGENSFQLYRLPVPRMGQILGLLGSNGTGKSTVLKILGGKLIPNMGKYKNNENGWDDLLSYYKGSELQNYFNKVIRNELKVLIKPQYMNIISQKIRSGIKDFLDKKNEKNNLKEILHYLELETLYEENRDISLLSGGELQRFCIAVVCIQHADVYMFDEPSSYLDIKQRINMAKCIRSLTTENNYIICVEHDLSILDYLSDYVCCLYGVPSAYGIVTYPYNVRDGINHFLEGYIPTENMRFRNEKLQFKIAETVVDEIKKRNEFNYDEMEIKYGNFYLKINAGNFSNSEITVLLAENGCGKSTFLRTLKEKRPDLSFSYKPQMLDINYDGTVRDYLQSKIKMNSQIFNNIIKPLQIEELTELECGKLSGGEMQRLSIAICLSQDVNVYLIDEPSAYLDSEQRINVAKVIKRYIMNFQKCCFLVEHDFIMTCYLADKIIVYEGIPGVKCIAHSPGLVSTNMNIFLKQLNITFRRDSENHRPRTNKQGSVKDSEQKREGNYF